MSRGNRLPAPIQGRLAPGAYFHPVTRVELIEMHTSWIFLASDRVYRVKKPVTSAFSTSRASHVAVTSAKRKPG